MSVTAPSPVHAQATFDTVARSRSRGAVIAIAFWHALRRDVVVTARGLIPFLIQAMIMPLSFLIVFGRILPGVGLTQQTYAALLLPGVVAISIFMTSLQGISVSLMVDLDSNREIDDRLLAPITVSLVAVVKIIYASLRSLAAAGLTFALAYVILGHGYQVRTDSIPLILGILVLYSLGCSALGLILGSTLSTDKIYLLFTLIFSTTVYTGCVYYSWGSISAIKVLQIITLFNPLTYAAEGLRYAMVPAVNGQPISTLPIGWALLGLSVSFLAFLLLGLRAWHRRVIG